MNENLHECINLKNTVKVWECLDCGKVFEDDGNYDSDICPECGEGNTVHVHVDKWAWNLEKRA